VAKVQRAFMLDHERKRWRYCTTYTEKT